MLKDNIFVKKIINALLNILIVLFVFILLCSLYIGVQTKLLGNKYANFFGYSTFEVKTGSMADTINVGDWIIVKLTKDVKLKDIVTYEYNGQYITHRIISIYGDQYITQGDFNNVKDKPIKKEQIIGKVVKIVGKLGIIREMLFNPSVMASLVVTLLLLEYILKKNEKDKKEIISKEEINSQNIPIPVEVPIQNETISESDVEEEVYRDEEIDKTTLYRLIPVDISDKEETLLEIAKHEMNTIVVEDITKKDTAPVEVIADESLTNINLDMMQERKHFKKGKNFIDSVVIMKTEEIIELLDLIYKDNKDYVRKITIRDKFISDYISAKYYNYFNNLDISYNGKDSITKIEKTIKNTAKELQSSDSKNDNYIMTINYYKNSLILIANLENSKNLIKDIKAKREFYKKEFKNHSKEWTEDELENIIDKTFIIQKKYLNYVNEFLNNLNTNMFNLTFNKFSSIKNTYGLELEHNILFSRVYSDYIINKTYSEGVIAEDKLAILFSLLSIRLIKDMILSDFNRNYILYITPSLYSKEKKLDKLFKMIDDKYAKENIYLLITLKDYLANKEIVKKIKKDGYRYALFLDKEVKQDQEKHLHLFEYIFTDKDLTLYSSLPNELKERIVYEDIPDKVGDIEGDEQ